MLLPYGALIINSNLFSNLMSKMFPGPRSFAATLFILLFIFTAFSCTRSSSADYSESDVASVDADGWTLLFDGETTDGWRGRGEATFPAQGWKIENGVLFLNGASDSARIGDVLTETAYANFILEWEWKMLTKGGNSGVKYLVKEDSDEFGPGFEYQMLDDVNHELILEGKMKPGDYHTTGALYELYPPAQDKVLNAVGEWNRSRVVVDGNHIEHWLNGRKVVECDRSSEDFKRRVSESKFKKYPRYGEATEGHILLQDHGSEMAFRNIRIKAL